jgi:hypothetical protein
MMRSSHERRGGRDVSAEENKHVIRRLIEGIYTQGRLLNLLDELAAQDIVNHPALPEHRHSSECFKHVLWWAHA